MKCFTKISWLIMAFNLLILPACNASANVAVAPTLDSTAVYNMVVGTVQALQIQTTQAVPTATNTPLPSSTPQPTNTPLPPDTPIPTNTPTATTIIVYPTPNSTVPLTPEGPIPSMSVTLIANDQYTYAETVYANQSLIFRAQVENTSDIPLQVVANLTVPDGWDVDQDKFSDCPTDATLGHKEVCTISWYFTPQVSGQVYLRVYVRGIYTDIYGNTQRITESPVFIFNVQPAKS